MNDFILDTKLFEITSPPGNTLLETIEAIGMSQAELALRTGRPIKTINEIIKGKAAITSETALQLEKVLGIPASFWNNRERQYRESLARKDERIFLENKIQWLDQIPVKEMVEAGWISQSDEPINQLEEILTFFGISSPDLWMPVSLGKYNNFEYSSSFTNSPGVVTAWLRKGEIEAQEQHCEPFNTKTLKDTIITFREFTSLSVQSFYLNLQVLCNKAGIAFCVVPELPRSNIHGVTRWITNDKALIQISDRFQQDDTFWFSFFHAIGHLMLHGKRNIFLEEDKSKNQKEEEADQFAEERLVQLGVLRTLLSTFKNISKENIQKYSNELGVSPGVLVGWLQKEEIIRQTQFNDLKRQLVWATIEDNDESPGDERPYKETMYESQTAQHQPVISAVDVWPGLSSGARQALRAAGYQNESGQADERLFAEWVQQQLSNVESSYNQGYYRDTLMDLENLISVVHIGIGRSPALETLVNAFRLISIIVQSSVKAKPEQELLMLARQAIVEVNRSTQEMMVSEARRQYSVVATRTESSQAKNPLNQW